MKNDNNYNEKKDLPELEDRKLEHYNFAVGKYKCHWPGCKKWSVSGIAYCIRHKKIILHKDSKVTIDETMEQKLPKIDEKKDFITGLKEINRPGKTAKVVSVLEHTALQRYGRSYDKLNRRRQDVVKQIANRATDPSF